MNDSDASSPKTPGRKMDSLDLLHQYASLGFHLFPLKSRSKEPATPKGFKDASPDIQLWAHWLQRGFNLGLATGPSNVFVIDYDPKSGGSRFELNKAVGADFPQGLLQVTGSGGTHELWVRHPDVKLTQRNGALGGIDLRAGTGYIVVAPSIHPNGKPYYWPSLSPETELRPMPTALLEWVRRLEQPKGTSLPLAKDGETGELWLAAGTGRWSQLQSIVGKLRWMGLGAQAMQEVMEIIYEYHCEPAADLPRKITNLVKYMSTKPSGAEQIKVRSKNGRLFFVSLAELGQALDEGFEVVYE